MAPQSDASGFFPGSCLWNGKDEHMLTWRMIKVLYVLYLSEHTRMLRCRKAHIATYHEYLKMKTFIKIRLPGKKCVVSGHKSQIWAVLDSTLYCVVNSRCMNREVEQEGTEFCFKAFLLYLGYSGEWDM